MKTQLRPALMLAIAGVVALAAVLYWTGGSSTSDPKAAGSGKRAGTAGRAVPVVTAGATAEDFAIRRRTIGIVETLATVVIKSRIDSQVLMQQVVDGQDVKKGDPLFTLDDREIQAQIARDQATLAKDNAALAQAQADLGRKQELIVKKVAPQQQLDQAVATYKAALQTVEADQAVLQADRLRLGYAKLEAPISGRVGAVRVTPGNLVGINDAAGLATITQMQPIRVGFTLPERDLAALRKALAAATPAVVRVYASGSKDVLATGALDFVDSSVDVTSGTIAAKAKFTNDNSVLWPGMYVDVEIDLDARPKTVMIPAVAIQSGQQGPFVFVAKADQTADMRKVELIGIEGDRAALASGVTEGERVIIEGQMRLTTGTRIAVTGPDGVAPGEPAKATRTKSGSAE